MDAEIGDDRRIAPAAGGDEHESPDWGAWLRARLERVASLEATPGEEQRGIQRPDPEEHTEQQGGAGPAPTPLGSTSGPDPGVVEELASLRAAVAALPSGVHPEVMQGLAALRIAIDDLGERLDGLTGAIVKQGQEWCERLDERVATLIHKLDDATATLAEQQRASRGAISEVLDGTSDAAASLRRLSSALGGAPAGGPGEEVLEALGQASTRMADASRASEAQAAELAVLGGQLGRMQEILDRLVAAPHGEGLASSVDPTPPVAAVAELDGAQTAAIADAVASMLLGADSPGHEWPEPRVGALSPPPRRRRGSPLDGPVPSPQSPVGEPPLERRRRVRSTPLRATPSRSGDDSALSTDGSA